MVKIKKLLLLSITLGFLAKRLAASATMLHKASQNMKILKIDFMTSSLMSSFVEGRDNEG